MRTSGLITNAVFRSFVEIREERKKRGSSLQTMGLVNRLIYFVLFTPAVFFIVVYFILSLGLIAAVTIGSLWLVSFLIGGYILYSSAVSTITQRPSTPSFTERRNYAIEDGWFVERVNGAEKRISLRRIEQLTVKPAASLLDFGELGLIYLPFGNASEDQGQREFLDALKSQLPQRDGARQS